MHKIIKDQLARITSTNIEFDDSTTSIFIPKTVQILKTALHRNTLYRIRLSDTIVHPSSNSTLASNWNAGRVPKNYEYNVELLDIMNGMYKFNGVAVDDPSDCLFHWVPENGFEIIS